MVSSATAYTEVRVFRSADGNVPLDVWLKKLKRTNRAVWNKSIAWILALSREGFRLQRPITAPLRDGIHELRPKTGRVNYRILYFFHKGKAVLTHGLTKESEVPNEEIEFAIYCRNLVALDEDRYTADFEE